MKWMMGPVLAASIMPVAPAAAKDGELKIDLSIRLRGEVIDGQFRPALPASDAGLLIKTDLAIDYDAGPIRFGAEVIDARVYLQRRNSSVGTTEVNALEPVQAYISSDISDRAQVTLGRFTMNLGSRRLISRQVFRNSTNAYTGARFDLTSRAGDHATLFWMLPQSRLPDDRDGIAAPRVELDRERLGLQLFGASITSRTIANTTVELYVYRLVEADAPGILTRNRRLWTPGMRIRRAPRTGKIDFEVEAMAQTGTTRLTNNADDSSNVAVAAWAIHTSVGKTFGGPWQPRLVASIDAASGDRPGGRFTRFDTLFGARAFEFGPTSFYGLISRQNLVSAEARLELTPDRRWDGYLAVRPLWVESATDSFGASGVRDPAGRAGRYAGTQIDARARYWLMPDHVRLAAGYTQLFKGQLLSDAANAPRTGDTRFGYLELTLTL